MHLLALPSAVCKIAIALMVRPAETAEKKDYT